MQQQAAWQRGRQRGSACVCPAADVVSGLPACVQVRVMPRCWYVLLRFWLRVDHVMVRLREVSTLSCLGACSPLSMRVWNSFLKP